MQINNSSSKSTSLYHDSLFHLGINRSDTTQYPVEDFIRNANGWYEEINAWIWEATGDWEYDDSNYTTLPIATGNLVDAQADYELPSTAQKIDRVEVKDNSGNWSRLNPIDKSQVGSAMDEFLETNGLPVYYDLVGDSMILYPTPATANITATSGLKVYFSRDVQAFNATSTTTVPSFNKNFHRLISYGAALDFASVVGSDKVTYLTNQIARMKEELQSFYGSRHRDFKTKIMPRIEDNI
jgi:hypothetical protein